jgi:uncharacterized Zn finger protein (UPF0148 family)
MLYSNFKIVAYPKIIEATCPKCNNTLKEVDNGWFSSALFCPKCESAFVLKLIKLPQDKIDKEWIAQSKEQIKRETAENRLDKIKLWAEEHLSTELKQQLKHLTAEQNLRGDIDD